MDNENRAELRGLENIKRFVGAGDATFTLVSEKTGRRFTYNVREAEFRDKRKCTFVSLLSGPDNEADYTYMGMLTERGIKRTAKSRVGEDAPSWKAIAWFLEHLAWGAELPAGVAVYHEGRCGACGRKLTVPESIETGLGPVCAARG